MKCRFQLNHQSRMQIFQNSTAGLFLISIWVSLCNWYDAETMKSTILERCKQVDKIEIKTAQSLTSIQAYGLLGEKQLEVDSDVHMILEEEFIRVILHRFLLKGFDLTWFTNLFKNNPVPPLKFHKYPSLNLELKNVNQQNGKIMLDYHALRDL